MTHNVCSLALFWQILAQFEANYPERVKSIFVVKGNSHSSSDGLSLPTS